MRAPVHARRHLLVALLLAGGAGCGHEHPHPHDDEHAHEGDDHADEGGHGHGDGPSVGITRFTDAFELFAEHPPGVVGEELPFLAHLTVLDGFVALEGARVRLVLEGPARLEGEADMLRSGIYRPVVTPTAAGDYQARLEVLSDPRGVIGGFTIRVFATEAEARASVSEADDDGSISFLKEQQWRVPFATAFAQRDSIGPTVEATGEITTPPEGRANLHAPVAGRVVVSQGGFPTPGRQVTAGEELLSLAPTPGAPEDAARAALAVVEAQNEVEAARASLERSERLLADRAAPERAVADARRRLAVAEASVSASRRAQGLFASASSGARGRGGWRITAPISGVVDAVLVAPGEAVEANALLVRIVDPRVRWLRARVPESWAPRMRPDLDVSFRLLGEESWRPVQGALVNVGSSVDATSRTVEVIWSLVEPPAELRVGASAEVALPVGEAVDAVVVPRAAVLDAEGRNVVVVQLEGERFEERAVRTGASDGARVAILEGLEAGERIVTRGGTLVRLAARAAEGGSSHGHVH